MNPLLTIGNVAELLQVSKRTVKRWEKRGLLKGMRLGEGNKKRLRFSEEAVKEFLEVNHTNAE